MIDERFIRTAKLLGADAMEALSKKRIAVFGLGGVGGYVCEALARSGIGAFDIVDKDTVDITNINRQIIASDSTIGGSKAMLVKERLLDINPDITVNAHEVFFLPETADGFDFRDYDYVADAVDTVTAKLEIIVKAKEANVPVISAMGAGNKLDPLAFEVSDIYSTSVCPLARVMRRELKKRGIRDLKVVYSKEPPFTPKSAKEERGAPASVAFVPPVAGLVMAREIVMDLLRA